MVVVLCVVDEISAWCSWRFGSLKKCVVGFEVLKRRYAVGS
jgi:hypothetical protein